MNSSGVVVEEPISSELVLVDEELARRARRALPDPPWLLPVLAELDEAARSVAVEEPPAPTVFAEPAPAPRRARRMPTAAIVVLLLFALAPFAYVLYSLLPKPEGPTLAARPEQQPATTTPANTGSTTRVETAETPAAQPKTKLKPKAAPARQKARTKHKPAAPAPKGAAKPKPRPHALAPAKRVFSWRRYPGAVYYQFYLQRGAKTIFQARTVQPTARLPARLRVLPGTYRVVVRPAVPSDAGIILGAVILGRTVNI